MCKLYKRLEEVGRYDDSPVPRAHLDVLEYVKAELNLVEPY